MAKTLENSAIKSLRTSIKTKLEQIFDTDTYIELVKRMNQKGENDKVLLDNEGVACFHNSIYLCNLEYETWDSKTKTFTIDLKPENKFKDLNKIMSVDKLKSILISLEILDESLKENISFVDAYYNIRDKQ